MVDFNLFQRVGDFFEQRKQFRAAALTALRKREGLPIPVDENNNPLETRFDDFGNVHYHNAAGEKVERVMFQGAGKDGKPGGFAVGARKGVSHEEADRNWNRTPAEELPLHLRQGEREEQFQILDTAEDGRKLSDELKDLDRDATGMEVAGRISHGLAGEQAPGLELSGTSDEEIDETLQKFLKRGL